MPEVSVIIPVYKSEEWFPQCLDSVHSQSYKSIELIVIDDSDGTGAAAARNRGLGLATAKYVMFVDSDDYLEPGAIQKLVDAIEGVDMVAGSFRKFGDFEAIVEHPTELLTLNQVAQYAMGNLLNPRHNQMLSGCWAKLFRRDMVRRFPNLTTAEDMAFNFEYLSRCQNVRFISDLVYHNRKREGSLSTTFDPNDRPGLFGFLTGLKYVRAVLAEFYSSGEVNKAIDNSKVYHSMLYFMRICAQTGEPMKDVLKRLYP